MTLCRLVWSVDQLLLLPLDQAGDQQDDIDKEGEAEGGEHGPGCIFLIGPHYQYSNRLSVRAGRTVGPNDRPTRTATRPDQSREPGRVAARVTAPAVGQGCQLLAAGSPGGLAVLPKLPVWQLGEHPVRLRDNRLGYGHWST